MENYQTLYTLLFNACTDAVAELEQMNFGTAKAILIRAQQQAEELYLSAGEQAAAEPIPAEAVNA